MRSRSHMTWLVGMVTVAVALCATVALAADEVRLEPIATPLAIASAQGALERAYAYTGFPRSSSGTDPTSTDTAFMVTMEENETPFLSDYVRGRRVWDVKIRQVTLYLPDWVPSFAAVQKPRDYDIWIDSATGVLFKIESRSEVADPDLAPEPPSDTATRMLRGCGEAWLGFPPTPPLVTFHEALNAAGAANPVEAKEIIAWHVMFSKDGNPPFPTWQIIGRGIPPLEFHEHPDRPLYLRNRMRSVVDAATGKEIMFSNMPGVLIRQGGHK
jgi:hypothetical protein